MLMSGSAMADETLQFVFDPSSVSYEGVWMDMGVGVAMYIPADWQTLEVSEELAATGVAAILASEDTAMVLTITVGAAMDPEGNPLTDTAALAALLANGGYEQVNELVVNGIPAVVYESTAGDVIAASYLTADGYVVVFTFGPKSDEAAALVGSTILLSMSVMAAE